MVKPDVVLRKLTRATDWLDRAENLLSRPEEAFLADKQAQDLASFYLFCPSRNASTRRCIGWSTRAGKRPMIPSSAFLVLADRRAIDRDLAEQLRGAVGLRNLIAHGYSLIDHSRMHQEYEKGIASLRRFLAAVADKAGV